MDVTILFVCKASPQQLESVLVLGSSAVTCGGAKCATACRGGDWAMNNASAIVPLSRCTHTHTHTHTHTPYAPYAPGSLPGRGEGFQTQNCKDVAISQ